MVKFSRSKESQLNAHGTPSAEKSFTLHPLFPRAIMTGNNRTHLACSIAPRASRAWWFSCLMWEAVGAVGPGVSGLARRWPSNFPLPVHPLGLFTPLRTHITGRHTISVSLLDSLLEWQVHFIHETHVGPVDTLDSWNKIIPVKKSVRFITRMIYSKY